MQSFGTLFLILFFLVNCKPSTEKDSEIFAQQHIAPVQTETQNGLKRAYFASGCFWCSEPIFENVKGVKESVSGYSGGHTKNPTYETTNSGKTGHAETVEIIYDPEIITFSQLLDVYFGSQNVTQRNGQGPDIGSQYRSIVFYQNAEEKRLIDEKMATLNIQLSGKKVAAEVLPFQKFWEAEAYHQDYKKHHPNNAYIQNVSNPRFEKFRKKFPELLKDER